MTKIAESSKTFMNSESSYLVNLNALFLSFYRL